MASAIHHDHLIVSGKGRNLVGPISAISQTAVQQQERIALAVDLVVDVDAVQIDGLTFDPAPFEREQILRRPDLLGHRRRCRRGGVLGDGNPPCGQRERNRERGACGEERSSRNHGDTSGSIAYIPIRNYAKYATLWPRMQILRSGGSGSKWLR